ncbi:MULTISPECIES: hypothetical protein [unclassified Bradyrhizobium]|uniref:hypothetical protein n=1 Tax=unclassified Bradyrhizobium TaxID=2631580 RepID=UPI0029161D58|nr:MULTISPECIES: hypothetical protein [unclassified Bradyrhizobium]
MRMLFAMVVLCLIASNASARPRVHHARHDHTHHHHHHKRHHKATPSAVPAHREAIGGRPMACAGIPWCGCWLRLRHGLNDVRLNLAARWARLGSPASTCRPGLIAVWPHHVGEVTACLGNGSIRMISGNDGHAVRDRVRPLGRAVLRDLH